MLINVYDEGIYVGDAERSCNLDMYGKPWVNGGTGTHMGLSRITEGIWKDQLALVYYNECYPNSSFGKLIEDVDARMLCLERRKPELLEELALE